MQRIGQHRRLFLKGEKKGEDVYSVKPYFAIRTVGLLSVKKDVTQILINCLDRLMWINVNPSDYCDNPDCYICLGELTDQKPSGNVIPAY